MQEITPQERTIMQIIWSAEDRYLTAREIDAAMLAMDGKERFISSLMTVLAKLADKGYLDPVKKFRKSTVFIPLLSELDYKAFVTEGFMNSVHNGEFSSFLSALVRNEKYNESDMQQLRRQLEALSAEGQVE